MEVNGSNDLLRGQAAVTDALYFIMIVTFLSIFLFGFSNTYGSQVRDEINSQFNTTFATNALKTILYSSTPRDAARSIYDRGAEIDYLLAILKEDYANDQRIDARERGVLAKNITSILSPLSDSLDYAFYITDISDRQYVFFYLHKTNFHTEDISRKVGLPRTFRYTVDKAAPHTDYFCAVGSGPGVDLTGLYNSVNAKLTRLVANVGPTSQASSLIKLVKVPPPGSSGSELETVNAQVDLVFWDATDLGTTVDRARPLFDPSPVTSQNGWDCVEDTGAP